MKARCGCWHHFDCNCIDPDPDPCPDVGILYCDNCFERIGECCERCTEEVFSED